MRLIDKETLCGLLADKALEAQLEDECTELAIKECLSIVRRMPEAVVRCRECDHKTHDGNGFPYCLKLEMYLNKELDFFCKYGEREEGADNDT